jgi:hypothetical protein
MLLCLPERLQTASPSSLRLFLSLSMAEKIRSSSKDFSSLDESSLCSCGFKNPKQRSSSCSLQVEILNRFARGTNISRVSVANLCCFTKGSASRVIMLWRRSANLISTARKSAIARNIVCKRSASVVRLAVLFSRASLLKWLSLDT